MKLSFEQSISLLDEFDHGTLCTAHPERGVDAVPVLYGFHAGCIGIPIDTVKPKSSPQLQRERNLELDPRATLLIEHWDRHDWSRLWWVRAELRWVPSADETTIGALGARLEQRFEQYREQPFLRMLTFELVAATGWAATAPA